MTHCPEATDITPQNVSTEPGACLQIGVWDVCLRAMTRLLPAGHGEEQVQYADMLVTANEAERRRSALCCLCDAKR